MMSIIRSSEGDTERHEKKEKAKKELAGDK